jgi:hypothetical protein
LDEIDVVQQTLIQLNEQIEGFDANPSSYCARQPYSVNCRVGAVMRLATLATRFLSFRSASTLESTIKPFTATLVADQGHFIRHVVSAYFGVVDTDLLVRG